jgi:hypothetical protein
LASATARNSAAAAALSERICWSMLNHVSPATVVPSKAITSHGMATFPDLSVRLVRASSSPRGNNRKYNRADVTTTNSQPLPVLTSMRWSGSRTSQSTAASDSKIHNAAKQA